MDRSTWISPEDKEIIRAKAMRERFESRKPNILNPHTRRLGVDIDALNQQVDEKRQIQSREKARNDAFEHQTLEQQRLLTAAMERERQIRRQMAQDDDRFRMASQRGEQSREFDIWRKDYKLIDHPMRQGDEDPNLGISAGQIFQGEDLKQKERLAMQAQQRTEWFQEQIREKEAVKRREQRIDLQNQLIELETQKKICELDAQTEAAKAAIRQQLAHDNLDLMNEKRAKEKADHEFEQMQNDAMLRYNANTRTITEEMVGRNDAPMEYRGMTVEEQKAIIDEQSRQMEENERLRQEEAERERQWVEYQNWLKAQGDLNEAEMLRRRAQGQRELYQTHLEQEEEFKQRQKYLNNELYGKNIPDDYYYNQWGKSIR